MPKARKGGEHEWVIIPHYRWGGGGGGGGGAPPIFCFNFECFYGCF